MPSARYVHRRRVVEQFDVVRESFADVNIQVNRVLSHRWLPSVMCVSTPSRATPSSTEPLVEVQSQYNAETASLEAVTLAAYGAVFWTLSESNFDVHASVTAFALASCKDLMISA